MNVFPLSNAHLSRLRKLKQRKYRWLERQYLIEGPKACMHLLETNPDLAVAFIVEQQVELPEWTWKTPVYRASKEIIAELSDTETNQGVLGVGRMNDDASVHETTGAVIVCDALQDPGNLGTIIRTARWFGCNTVLLGTGTTDPFQPKVVRSTAGAIAQTRFLEVDLPSGLQPWLNNGYKPFVLDMGTDFSLLQTGVFPEKSLFIIGNEGNGVGKWADEAGFTTLAIPGAGTLESLNAAVSASITLFSWYRSQTTTR